MAVRWSEYYGAALLGEGVLAATASPQPHARGDGRRDEESDDVPTPKGDNSLSAFADC